MKEPWFAFLLSFLFPGAGFYYLGKRVRGIFTFLVVDGLFLWGGWFILGPSVHTLIGWFLVVFAIILNIENLVELWLSAKKEDRVKPESQKTKRKVPYLAILLTSILPGLGHFYIRRHIPGVLFLVTYILLLSQGPSGVIGNLVDAILMVIALLNVSTEGWPLSSQARLILITAIVVPLFSLTSFYDYATTNWVRVEFSTGDSNSPTLMEGDLVVLDLETEKDLKIGDFVVLFLRLPVDYETRLILKRVIGLEGQEVYIDSGSVYINREKLMGCQFSRIHYSVDSTCIYGTSQKPYVIPKGYIFVLGDNPQRSTDSRQLGGIERASVVAVVRKVIWPLGRIKNLDSCHE